MSIARFVVSIQDKLARPRKSLLSYCLFSSIIAFVPALVLLSAMYLLMKYFDADMSMWSQKLRMNIGDILGVAIFAPIIETTVLIPILIILKIKIASENIVSVIAALFFGVLHSVVSLFWLIGPVWTFFIYSNVFFAWQKRSIIYAFFATVIVHSMSNIAALAIGFVGECCIFLQG